ncbi:DNA helicase RecQ [Shouchella shacheensis]|uniref:DNA helicase RecQ n=1 Tax=Shouchella shacheensis TaxID=1649580 RepID=UPI00074032E5|nr:DNA helicase RecQ [Shouchella shacheensis]
MASVMLKRAEEVLNEQYGYASFRDGQKQVIDQVLRGMDTLAVMPTGGGKSLCYQIPAVLLEGITLVISPLISLMKDQVDAVNELGVAATFINSSLTRAEENERLQQVASGEVKLLYVAPERLREPRFVQAVFSQPLSLIAIDEAHCMSQWGHDFRPSYLTMADWIHSLEQKPPVLALTATATPEVAADISERFQIEKPQQMITGFARNNLAFRVVKGVRKKEYVARYVQARSGLPGIVYASTRKETEAVFHHLKEKGISVELYHGGLSEEERRDSQEAFIYDRCDVMVATNAFGMGINKANVRYVIHANMPGTVEAYYQEAGRAGRDGEMSECVLLFSAQDVRTQRFFIEQSEGTEQRQSHDYEKLQQINAYCHTDRCLEEFVLHYFGEQQTEECGRCGNCLREGERVDRTKDAQMVLSCIVRMREHFGKTMVAQVLTGSKNQKIQQFQLDKLPTYGLMKERSAKDVQAFIDFLLAELYTGLTNTSYPTLELLPRGAAVLKGEEKVLQYVEAVPEQEEQDDIFEALRARRKDLAGEQGLPPYMVFSDKTLREMSRIIPLNKEEFAMISGVGAKKQETYGEALLDVLRSFADRKSMDLSVEQPLQKQSHTAKRGSHLETISFFKEGMSVEKIAHARQLSEQTIVKHLLKGEEEEGDLELKELVDEDKRQQIEEVAKEVGTEFLRPIKEKLPDTISYAEISFTLGR